MIRSREPSSDRYLLSMNDHTIAIMFGRKSRCRPGFTTSELKAIVIEETT